MYMLAMYVVLESYLQMVCDYPAAYEDHGFEFIKEVPAVWDETKVIDANGRIYFDCKEEVTIGLLVR
jgi:alpha-glucosidase